VSLRTVRSSVVSLQIVADDHQSPASASAGEQPRRPGVHALWAMGWLLVAAMAAFQVYDVLRRRDIVLETAEQRFASLAHALSEQTASSVQVVDVVLRDTASDLQLPQSPGKEQRSEDCANACMSTSWLRRSATSSSSVRTGRSLRALPARRQSRRR
jgi:hypothetical protein